MQLSIILKRFYIDKAMINVSDGCPYDCSGALKVIREAHMLSDYKTLEDFLEMKTGTTTATYISGCGLNYNSYADELEQNIRDSIYNIARDYFISESKESYLIDDDKWYDFLDKYDNEYYDNFCFPIEYAVYEILEELKPQPFFKILEKYAPAQDSQNS